MVVSGSGRGSGSGRRPLVVAVVSVAVPERCGGGPWDDGKEEEAASNEGDKANATA